MKNKIIKESRQICFAGMVVQVDLKIQKAGSAYFVTHEEVARIVRLFVSAFSEKFTVLFDGELLLVKAE